MAIINGTAGNNILNGTTSDDEISGFGGYDQLFGNFGDDQLLGGSGNDKLFGGWGDDTLNGGSGNDTLKGGDGNDLLNGGTGADIMDGGVDDDFYIVDNVNDVAKEFLSNALSGVDTVESSVTYTLGSGIENLTLTGSAAINGTGNEKNNVITGNNATNVLNGGDGNDTITDDYSNGDKLYGGNGNDTLFGGWGLNLLDGGTGADTMDGGPLNDTYIVDNVNDKVSEANDMDEDGENDTVLSSVTHTLGSGIENLTLTGSTTLNGTGNEDDNIMTGNSANNVLSGRDGYDSLNGGSGNDTLYGGSGWDTLYGGAGADVLTGGLHGDFFKYKSVGDSPAGIGRDIITDFAGAGADYGDWISLTEIDANSLMSGNQAFTYIGSAAFTAAGELRYSGGILSGSTDADTAAEFQIQLVGAPTLFVQGGHDASDILL